MKFHYYPETDSLYIELTERSSVDSQEASPGVVLDYDSDGSLVGIDIDHASSITDVSGIGDTRGGKVSLVSLLSAAAGSAVHRLAFPVVAVAALNVMVFRLAKSMLKRTTLR